VTGNDQGCADGYVGQVERDPDGMLWAVLYYGAEIVEREQVRSLRKGRRRVTDLVLAAADNYPNGPLFPAAVSRLASLPDQPAPSGRRLSGVPHLV